MEAAALRRRGDGSFLLEVPGLLESRPSLMRGDSVVATRLGGARAGWQARAPPRETAEPPRAQAGAAGPLPGAAAPGVAAP